MFESETVTLEQAATEADKAVADRIQEEGNRRATAFDRAAVVLTRAEAIDGLKAETLLKIADAWRNLGYL